MEVDLMDKYELSHLLLESPPVDNITFIQDICRGKKVLDLGCVRHNAEFATKDPNWIHQKITDVAKTTIGIDYMVEEITKLQNLGYDIRFGDVTKPLPLDEQFDVIVAGFLIHLLTNFDGFFENCSRLLKKDGVLIISTANPFFTDEFHYVAYKKNFLINPEHTCWIDPQCLFQMAHRLGFRIIETHYLTDSWHLGNMICERKGFEYDILNDQWSDNSFQTKLLRFVTAKVFGVFYFPIKTLLLTNTKLVRHSDYIAILKKD
jgi:SAM-dependent methyltransferase